MLTRSTTHRPFKAIAILGAVPMIACGAGAWGGGSSDLEAPFRVEAGGEPINVEVDHAAPWLHDFDGDGVNDLLVGQFGSGKLRIYRNHGSNSEPSFKDFEYFKAGHDFGVVPTG